MKKTTTSTNTNTFTFGIFDEFENKLRMGFVSHDIKQLAIATANKIVEVSLAGGEETYKFYENKTLRFKDALEIFETHGFILAVVPSYMEFLLEKGPQVVVSTDKEVFFDGSNEGVKLLKIYHRNDAETVARYYDATDSNKADKGIIDIPSLASEVTWKQAIEVMKTVQEKHGIDLFAPGYFDTCSCCAIPKDFPKKYFLNKEDAGLDNFVREDGSKIKSMVLSNAHNISGAPKLKSKKGPEVFGMLTEGMKDIQQYVYTRNVTTEETKLVLDDFVNGLNELIGEETYSLEVPEEDGYAFAVVTKQ